MTSPVVTYELDIIKSEFQANTFETGDQRTPDVLGLSTGGYVVAYNSGPAYGYDIRLDFYDANGQVVAGAVDPGGGAPAGTPSLTELDDGNVLVVWDDNGGGHLGTNGAIYSPTGQVVVPEFDITTSFNDFNPQVTTLEGGFVVSYMDTAGNLNFRVFDNDGDYQSGLADISGALPVLDPVVTTLQDGGFVVVWRANQNVVARIFEADGAPRPVNGSTDPFVVGAIGTNSQPAVAALPNGNFAVAYADTGWGGAEAGSAGITLTIFGPDGSIVNAFEHVNTPGASNESDPDIAVLDNGFIVVTWTDPAGNNEILGRIFDQDGDPVDVFGGAPLPLSDSPGSDDIKSAVSGILAGQFITAWQDSQSDGDGGQITALVTELVRHTTGTSAGETLTGDELRDFIDGGGGADTMEGGAGDDTYVVDNAGDVVVEAAGGGTDEVRSSVSFVLGSTLENLTLTGGANVNGTGNAGANVMIGNSGSNTLTSYGGNDRLDGGGGADAMIGGNGDDTYVVDNAGDTASEASGSGVDTVQSTVSFTLGAGIEKLVLNGAAAINGTGNGSANTISGNSAANQLNGLGGSDTLNGFGGNDRLDGGAGADAMSGGNGNDTYVVDNAGDTASEASGSGVDTVSSTVSFTLAAGVEKLVLNGAAAVNGTGNGSANTMSGNSAANRLDGNAGNDTLTGFGGADVFVFDDGDGEDTITDFQNGSDKFDVSAVAGVDEFSDLVVIDDGSAVIVEYGSGSFTLANIANPALVDASDFVF